ncbi:hypothetical protein PA598K_02042 [Paenibacillus sp. 598K]|nr:hypothetical protein PA598K_02042 [Paenibacillus sp. 598K]
MDVRDLQPLQLAELDERPPRRRDDPILRVKINVCFDRLARLRPVANNLGIGQQHLAAAGLVRQIIAAGRSLAHDDQLLGQPCR